MFVFPQLLILYIVTIIKTDSIINDCYIFNVLFGVYICWGVWQCSRDGTQPDKADLHHFCFPRVQRNVVTSCPDQTRKRIWATLPGMLPPPASVASTGDQFTSGESSPAPPDISTLFMCSKQFWWCSFSHSSRLQRAVGAEFWTYSWGIVQLNMLKVIHSKNDNYISEVNKQ